MSPEEMAAKMIDAWDQLDRVRRERDDWRQRAELLEFELKNDRLSNEVNREELLKVRIDAEKLGSQVYKLETQLARTNVLLAEARAQAKKASK